MSFTFLNLLYHTAHLSLMLFLMTGWLSVRTLRLHLWAVAIVWLSWLVLGYMVGYLGYCVLTDLHWQLLREAAHADGTRLMLPPSYVEYLLWQLGSGDLPDRTVTYAVAVTFLLLTGLSITRNIRLKRRNRTVSTK
jgi:Protein of Unknown function (DUF2784)